MATQVVPAIQSGLSLDHIAAAINAEESTLFAMLTGYFDDAGGADHGYTVVAGWVSTVERWRGLAEQWEEMLTAFEVPYFDMKTLSHFKGVYAKWEEQPQMKSEFIAAACRVIASSAMYQFASIVPHAAFAKANESYRLKEHVGNEYALVGVSCALRMRDWVRENVPQSFEVVFEDGTAKRGKLVDVMRKEHFAEPIFRPSKPTDDGRPHVVQLQAADFLAYEVRKVKKDNPDETRAIEDHRISLRKLIWVDSDWRIYTERDLIESCERHPHIGRREKLADGK
jgi:hypothetical protein